MTGLYIIDGDVKVSEDYMALPEFKAFFSENKELPAEYFTAAMKYLYYVFRYDGPLKDMYFTDRQEYVCKNMLNSKYSPKDFEQNYQFKKLSAFYAQISMTFLKRDYEQTKKDIESLNKHISTIPFVKKIALKNYMATFEYEGKVITTTVNIDVEIDNSKEKADALKLKEILYDLEEKLKQKINKEEMSSDGRPMSLLEEMQNQ